MAQAKKKTATRTKKTSAKRTSGSRANTNMRKNMAKKQQGSNIFFVISMTAVAITLLFANVLLLNA